MAIEFEIILQGHDWENDLHFSQRAMSNVSLFQHLPESLLMRLEVIREAMERQYKDAIIKQGKHIKLVK